MSQHPPSRRDFIRTSSLVATAAALPLLRGGVHAGGSDAINIGVVGCGGRGSGAVADCLSVNEGVRLVAMGDLWADRCRRAREHLASFGDKVQVTDDAIYDGLDAYRKVIHHPSVDLVLLTTSPGFRPLHLAEAVAAGKHVFVEKPVCVDATGYRSCIASGAVAKAKGLAVVSGTQFRRQPSYREAISRIHGGMIGRVIGGTAYYCATGIWYRERQTGMSDTAYQLDNWYHFVWLSGDQIVEQAVHNLDAINWVMGGPPVSAFGSGGQMTRPRDSEIYDHVSLDYTYANGAIVSFKCRQIPGTTSRVSNTILGSEGVAHVDPESSKLVGHDGTALYRHRDRGNNPYQQEHKDLVDSIRAGTPIMEIQDVADSSLTAVMGRMAAYSGKEVTFELAKASKEDLMPRDLAMDAPRPLPKVAIPGTFELV